MLATTLADRGSSVRRTISPKKSPAARVASTCRWLAVSETTRTWPDSMR